jgi:hypothetical protein
MLRQIDADRRRFLGSATMSVAAAQFGMMGSTAAQPVLPQEAPQAFAQAIVDVDGF